MKFSTARAALLGSSLLAVTMGLSACATPPGEQPVAAEPVAAAAAAAPALMPVPSSVAFPGGSLPLGGGFVVSWSRPPSAMMQAAAGRFLRRADALAGRVLPAGDGPVDPKAAPVPVRIEAGQDAGWLTTRAKEDYRLVVGPDGATLTADGPDGVMHGLATLAQLIGRDENGPKLAFATIADHPRFAWRGIMIDTSRHFVAVETLKRQIDAMEMLKLDVLHLHLSDGTGFRVESHVLPELTAKGSHGQYYTQAQIRDVVAYAGDRGIRVVPEFDLPGHALAVLLAHPELAARSPVDPEPKNKNTAALDPTLPATLRLVRQLYGEMGRLFPDIYFHSGGDEVDPDEWMTNPKIVAWMKDHGYATPQALQAAFTAQVQKVLAAQGKIMVGWDEVSEAAIPSDVVVDVWRSSKFIASATEGHHPVIVSAGYYLDLLQPAGQHYLVDPYDPAANGITREQADRLLKKGTRPDLVAAFLKEPAPPPLTDAQKAFVLGGEAPLWAELVTDEMLDARIWPRAAAIAERFWSPAEVRDVDDMYRRLAVVNAELQITGLQGEANRWRMAARLSPGTVDPVMVLASATVPLRNYNMNRYVGRHGNRLDEIGEIASPDPAPALRFSALVARYVAGDHSVVPALRRQLATWRDNDAAFAPVAQVRGLSDALVTSRHLAVIAGAGLKALDGERTLSAPDRAIFDQEDAAINSSADVSGSFAGVNLPPAGLMIAIEPAVRKLLGL
ncbi:beta-N-acetylhexosaminidase [Gluconacetobacter takamatsuzukensis]|uniref:N-acetyl-beta-glucosaminidase n=1 Tax=Gluconacetobacter takamatsuzukensis TaxID=1286190 RepID=A0A7W4PSR8_9PROT|nr:family 20 glycosylhydrolase [Gluconacetobacter takamatsuzukensis]MBB2205211.1 family 20 glycosylhydrolase [Gluconacetobacter takamatsuzukensis]